MIRKSDNAVKNNNLSTAKSSIMESEEKYRKVFATSRDAFFLIDKETGAILDVNDSACRLYGYTMEEMLKLKNTDMSVEPEETNRAMLQLKDRIPLRVHKKKDGTLFPVDISASFFVLNGRQVALAAIRDITDRRKTEEALRESEEKFRTIAEQTSDLIAITDFRGFITYASSASMALFYLTPQEMTGRNFTEFFDESVSAKAMSAFQKVIENGERTKDMELLMKRSDKSVFIGELNGSKYHCGMSSGALVVIRDITKRKKAEEEIRKLNAELEQKVLDRTAKLEASNKNLESFSYSVAHDLRTPLRAINGFCNILNEQYASSLDDEAKRLCRNICTGTDRMGLLINELLGFVRLGRLEMRKMTVNMNDMVRSVLNNFDVAANSGRIDISVTDLPVVQGDKAMIRQVCENLISNAIKFSSKKDKPVIEIGCRIEEDLSVITVPVLIWSMQISFMAFFSGFTVKKNLRALASVLRLFSWLFIATEERFGLRVKSAKGRHFIFPCL